MDLVPDILLNEKELYFDKDRRFKNYTPEDSFQIYTIEQIMTVNWENPLESLLMISWIGFPNYPSTYTIQKMLESARLPRVKITVGHMIKEAF